MKERQAGINWVDGRPYARVRIGRKRRLSVPMPAVLKATDEEREARRKLIAKTVNQLVEAGRADIAKGLAVQVGKATSARALKDIQIAVDEACRRAAVLRPGKTTFKDLGDRWVSGDLARMYPDHIKKKRSAKRDEQLLKKYVYPTLRDVPIEAVTLEDCELVMRRIADIEPDIAPATRRHVAQVMNRIFNMAKYPLKLIKASPLPEGFLPKLGPGKAKQYLYPDEEAKLLGCTRVPLLFRVFYGFIGREGTRLSEARLLEWTDVDLERGVLRLDQNKTDDPRAWAMQPDTVRALKAWKERLGKKSVGPFVEGIPDDQHDADRFRAHLKLAGVDRAELHEATDAHTRIRVHDLRATFVTVNLANGRSEMWIADRTGHKSSTMIARYRRAARTLEELNLGPLRPLDTTLVWAEDRGGTDVGQPETGVNEETAGTEGGTRTLTSFRTADFESNAGSGETTEGAENKAASVPAGAPRSPAGPPSGPPGQDPEVSAEAVARAAKGLADQAAAWADFDRFQEAVERSEKGGAG